jgi:malate dehydrogenase
MRGNRDATRSLPPPPLPGDRFTVAVCLPGDYGIEKGLIFSYLIRSNGLKWEIVQNIPLNKSSRAKVGTMENELKEERALVADLLPK